MKVNHFLILLSSTFILMQCTPSNQPVLTETVPPPPTNTVTADIIPPTATFTPTLPPPEMNLEINVPQGPAPTIDGKFSAGEWDGAFISQLSDGTKLMMLHDGEYLFIGIQSRTMGVGSVCVKRGDQVWILHASAALGNAIYEKAEDGWAMTEGFTWCCRGTTPNVEQQALLEENNWTASIGYMGKSNEMEYQIAMEEEPMSLAVAYYFNQNDIPIWPRALEDDCNSYGVVDGTPRGNVQFDIDAWSSLTTSGTE